MGRQLIISVGREFGSGGHVIAEALADRFGLPLYDNNLLENAAAFKSGSHEEMKQYDEVPKNRLFSRTVRGFSNSMQENVANIQFEHLKSMAENGESFVIVGRCAESKLKEYEGLISIFVLGDRKTKKERVKQVYNLSDKEAELRMEREDRRRKTYHNYYCSGKWGDSRNYDLSVNSSKLGIERTVDMLEIYIKARINE